MKEKTLTFVTEREVAFKMSTLSIQCMHTLLVDCQNPCKLLRYSSYSNEFSIQTAFQIILWLLKHITAAIIINVITDLLLYIGRLIKAEEENTSVELTIITFTSGMQQSASGIVHRCIKSIKYKISQVDCQLHWASSSVFNHTGHFMYFFFSVLLSSGKLGDCLKTQMQKNSFCINPVFKNLIMFFFFFT